MKTRTMAVNMDSGGIKQHNGKDKDENQSSPNPMEGLSFWDSIVIPEEHAMKGLPEDMLDLDSLPPIVDYRNVMTHLQKAIAMEHAKKVKEGKESVNMNVILREKYGADNYHFPDRVLNAGLCKKDFTAPFLIDVKQIHQDMGKPFCINHHQMSLSNSITPQNFTPTMKRKVIQQQQSGTSQSPTITNLQTSATLFDVLKQKHQQQYTPSKRIKMEGQKQALTSVKSTLFSSSTATENGLKQNIRNIDNNNQNNNIYDKNGDIDNNNTEKETGTKDDDFFLRIIPTDGSFRKIQKPTEEQNEASKFSQSSKSSSIDNTSEDNVNSILPSATKSVVQYQPPKQTQPPPPASSTATASLNQVRSEEKGEISTVRCSGFLGCKFCGKTFPSLCDNLYRSHMLIKHDVEVTDAEITQSQIKVKNWHKCKFCNLMLINNLESHHKKCSPNVQPFEHAFIKVSVMSDEASKLVCGVCNLPVNSKAELRGHLMSQHRDINNRIILDPYFRCATCLCSFVEAKKLFEHVKQCQNSVPTPETISELTLKNLGCQIHVKRHAQVRETLLCYQKKNILRCVLCLFASKSRDTFFNHLKVYHGRRKNGICCPFCNDNVEKPVREAFDHFIDAHLTCSNALKRSGENPSTLYSSTVATPPFPRPKIVNIQGHDLTSSSTTTPENVNHNNNNNNINHTSNTDEMPKLTRSDIEQPPSKRLALTDSSKISSQVITPVPTPVIVNSKQSTFRNPIIEKSGSTPSVITTTATSTTINTTSGNGKNHSLQTDTAFTAGSFIARPVLVDRGTFCNFHLALDFPLEQIVEAATSQQTTNTPIPILPIQRPNERNGEDSILEFSMDKI